MHKFIRNGTITSVKGFKAAGIFCGIKRKKKDLALIYSETPSTAAGTFTLNKVKAAPLIISQNVIQLGSKVKAILINSGNANACTGEKGFQNALAMQKYCAFKLGLDPNEVLISSTGVIGEQLPIEKIDNGIDVIVNSLSASLENGNGAAEAIMTTDTRKKSFAVNVKLSRGEIMIGGICKGSGMIMPNMATMLAFLGTDVIIKKELLQELLSKAVKNSFNKISVDGETSTNDMVTLMANGTSGISIGKESDESVSDYQKFYEALLALCKEMAKEIVADGEGATKLVQVNVTGALTEEIADLVAKAVSNSPLVKTALNGRDANWGRIISAAGSSGADIDPSKISISFGELPVLKLNYNIVLDEKAAFEILSKDKIEINIDLGMGSESTTWWTCDFSENYIRINADYRT